MANYINEEITTLVKDLIKQITSFEDGTEVFTKAEKSILTTLKKSDTMYFLNKREVDEVISGMAEKYIFHGFFPEARALQEAYKAYITEHLPKSELISHLNIVKLLLCLSERPTSKFLENPVVLRTEKVKEEDEINWAEYLNEGIERWTPVQDETSASEDSVSDDGGDTVISDSDYSKVQMPIITDATERETVVDFKANREELLATIQHSWYNQKYFHMVPFSGWREANIGILWEKFLKDQVRGLIPLAKCSVITEYLVIREILWQLWVLHTSAVFELDGGKVVPKSDITISSVRAPAFQSFLKVFIPYMEVMDFFKNFSKSVEITTEDSITAVPLTYRSYNSSLRNIIRPVYKKLIEIEKMVAEQEETYTLLRLADDLMSIFEPIMHLKKIHDEVVIDFQQNAHFKCATVLIAGLHNSLRYSYNKLDQDLRVTLFLESLYHYFTLINSWFMKNDLSDYSEEFLIINKNFNLYDSHDGTVRDDDGSYLSSTVNCENCKLNFELRDGLDEFCSNNTVIRIIRETVLQIGRNIHLLRLLGKYSVINDSKETIYEEFVRRTLEELDKFFNVNSEKPVSEGVNTEETLADCTGNKKKYKYPVVCPDDCPRPTEFDKLENLVDTTDGFLMLAFEGYFVEKPEDSEVQNETLFEKISNITTTLFPVNNFFEKILNGLLKDRFMISGLMVKNILIEEHLLEKHFQFLRHVFLFHDDMIFPFYRRLFENINGHNRNWGNKIWLTSHLQDVIADVYPELYERCLVQVRDNWKQCLDPLEACGMVSVQYDIRWPLNIIITSSQMERYKDIFQFVMKIKWALYTVNHLAFTDLEPKKLSRNQPGTRRNAIAKLKYLKFVLINGLNSIQHYLFSFVFTKCLRKFELEFEKANDLASIMASHASFIDMISGMISDVRQSKGDASAFKNVMVCVKLLKTMWGNVELATSERLNDCYKVYKEAYSTIEPIICPVYIFDY